MLEKNKEELIAQLDKILVKLSKDLETSKGKETTKILKKIDSTLDERLKLMD
jgi:hypothetical protein